MKKILTLIASLIALVFTVVLVAFLYVVNWDPNEHKDWIAGRFLENTGREIALNGEIGLSLYPWLGITVNDVSVGNSPGFSDVPLVQAERAEVRIKLIPMLNRDYEIDTIRLSGARLQLETNATGGNNWTSPATTGTGPETVPGGEPVFNSLVIGGVDILNAAVTFDDRFNGVRYEFSDLTVRTDELVYGQPVDITLGVNAAATRPALSARIDLTGTVVYDLDNRRFDLSPLTLTSTLSGENVPDGSADIALSTTVSFDAGEDLLTLRDFSLNALGAQVNANINGNGVLGDSPLFQINLAAAGSDLAVLFRILENDELAGQIADLNSGAFSINGLVEASPAQGILTVTGLDASLLDATIRGDINATGLQTGRPVINGTISAAGPDLPTLLEVAGQFQGGRNSPLAQYGRELQRAPNQDFLLDTEFNANLDTGNIDIPQMQARLFGATLTGHFTASGIQSDSPNIRGQIDANGPDLPLMMQIAGQLTGGREAALNRYGRQLRNVSNKSFNINAPFDANLATGNIEISSVNAAFLGFRLNGELSARDFRTGSGSMSGKLTLSGNNPAEVLNAIEQPDLAEIVRSVALNIAVDGTRTNLAIRPLNLELVLSGPRIPNSPVTLALNAASVLNLEAETLRTDNFNLSGLGLNLNGSINASDFLSDISYNGRVTLPPFNLRRFMQQINQPLPPTMDNTVFQTLSLNTGFTGSTNDIRLSGMELVMDDSRFTGDFTLAGFDNPAVNFDLDVSGINLDRYLAPETDTPANRSDIGNTELPVDSLRALNLKGKLDVGRLTYSNLNLNDLGLNINGSDGQLALAPISASLYEGSYKGDIRLNVNGETPVASVDTGLTGVNLAPLLQDFMDATYITGRGNVTLALTGSGADTATIKRNLNGSGSLELQDGILRGVDVGSVLAQVETMIRSRTPARVVRGEQTPFDTFTATIKVNNGNVTSDDLLIESSGFDITGRGTLVNLTDNTIAYNLRTIVDETPASDEQAYDIGGYTLPIACTGTLETPRCLPDIQEIVSGAIRSAVQQGLTGLLERAIGGQEQQQTTSQDNADSQQQQQEEEEETPDPKEELINRALESIFRR